MPLEPMSQMTTARFNLIKCALLVFVFCGIAILPVANAEEKHPSEHQAESAKGSESPKSAFEVVGTLLGTLAWPAVALVIFYCLKTPVKSLLTSVAVKAETAKDIKIGDLFSISSSSTEEFKAASEKQGVPVAVVGNPDVFQLVCKAHNKILSKSTKVMNLSNGCLVQVSTKEVSSTGNIAVAEALAFIPGLNVLIPGPHEAAQGTKITFKEVQNQ